MAALQYKLRLLLLFWFPNIVSLSSILIEVCDAWHLFLFLFFFCNLFHSFAPLLQHTRVIKQFDLSLSGERNYHFIVHPKQIWLRVNRISVHLFCLFVCWVQLPGFEVPKRIRRLSKGSGQSSRSFPLVAAPIHRFLPWPFQNAHDLRTPCVQNIIRDGSLVIVGRWQQQCTFELNHNL